MITRPRDYPGFSPPHPRRHPDQAVSSLPALHLPMSVFKPLKPGVQLMRSLRLPVKLGVLALVLLVPLALISWTLVQRLNASIAFTEAELAGTNLVQATGDVIRAVQKHRGQ
ncbi:hypothetical protein RZS08_17635, partial [Arthrospira platensis SPKY1]|nr:hypothetical protein [Arthrospira platensis SPKY1]